MNFLGFGQSAEIDIVFDGADNRKLAEIKTEDSKKEKYLLYYDGETVSGKVNVTLKKPGSKLEHQGIKIEFIGQIELYYDRGNHHEFTSLVRELARPGDLIQNTSYPFNFDNVEKPYEVYIGSNVRLRYFLRVTIVRRLSDIVREIDIAVHTLCSYPEINSPIKMEVGIEDCLHIEFEYNKSKYHLKDVIVGKIYFLLVRIKIKHMEIAIIKRETTGSGPNTFTENETIAKYEIMDGAPVRGESIPIRVFLAGYDLTPTMRDINKKFSVRYFLNLVLMDTEDRRYFKQQEITLWRKADKIRKPTSLTQAQQPSHLIGTDDNNMKINFPQHQIDDEINTISPIRSTDPTMGLFIQESPQQEVKTITTSTSLPSQELPLPITTEHKNIVNNIDNDSISYINEPTNLFDGNKFNVSGTIIKTNDTEINSQLINNSSNLITTTTTTTNEIFPTNVTTTTESEEIITTPVSVPINTTKSSQSPSNSD